MSDRTSDDRPPGRMTTESGSGVSDHAPSGLLVSVREGSWMPAWDLSQFEALVANVPGAVYRTEPTGWRVQFMSAGIELITGYPAAEWLGDSPLRTFEGVALAEDHDLCERVIHAGLARGESWTMEYRMRHRDGGIRSVLERGRGVLGADGEVLFLDGVIFDNTDRKRIEDERDALLARVEAMARTDALTGLPNRRAWDEELSRELARARGRPNPVVVVAMLDLDHFKAFNDKHGHLAGDDLLRDVADEWRLRLRLTDFVARYGGEEFGVLLPDCSSAEAATIVDRLRAALPPGETCSAGVAFWDGHESAGALLGRADTALYEAKRAGRDQVAIAA